MAVDGVHKNLIVYENNKPKSNMVFTRYISEPQSRDLALALEVWSSLYLQRLLVVKVAQTFLSMLAM